MAAGGYASDLLRAMAQNLTSRDAGLAAQIVFGCLRYQGQLDYLIWHYSGRESGQLDEPVRIALRAAIFQMRYLERIPARAAVHESVEYVKGRTRAASGLVNAILRKVNREPVKWPDPAIEFSCPSWLMERWSSHFGSELAQGIAAAALKEPLAYVRVPPGQEAPREIEVATTEVPGAFQLLSPLPTGMRLHDISSQSIIPLLGLSPGDTLLDLCAAPGNKTLQALETPLAATVACDVSLKRLQDVPPVCPRVVLDASLPLPFDQQFTRIFIDAPCSGTGTLARNPEIKWRLKPEELARFQGKQAAILAQALCSLAPGGKLLYATCSLEREENEEVVGSALSDRILLRTERWRLPGRDQGDGFYAAVLESAAQ